MKKFVRQTQNAHGTQQFPSLSRTRSPALVKRPRLFRGKTGPQLEETKRNAKNATQRIAAPRFNLQRSKSNALETKRIKLIESDSDTATQVEKEAARCPFLPLTPALKFLTSERWSLDILTEKAFEHN